MKKIIDLIKRLIKIIKGLSSIRMPLIWLYINSTHIIGCIIRFLYGIDKNKVVFIANVGKLYSCNPLYISEALHRINQNIKIIWIFNNPDDKRDILPDYVIPVKNNSLRAFYELSTAKCWVDNCLKKFYKADKQLYIQTWHGDRGFKAGGILNPNYYNRNKPIETRQIDCFISGSVHFSDFVKKAYSFNGKILKYGCPRNDILIENNKNIINNIRKRLGVSNEKILLYAPTYRRGSFVKGSQNSDIDFDKILEKLKIQTNSEWILLFRAHPNLTGLNLEKCKSKHIDVTMYENMNELLLISDLLITDYSSCAGDFALTGKPIILYQPDTSNYKKEQGFTKNFTESPYYIAFTKKELEGLISNYKNLNSVKNDREILDFYKTHETGIASLKVAEFINDKLGENV